MGDEVRRSGRATKGQNPKNQDDGPDVATPKQRGKGGRPKASKKATPSPPPEDPDAIIRCICGYVVEDKDDERVMIQCDSCQAWQHNECMEVSEDPAELPDNYFCELCKPEDHVELLAKVTRGEKPWEERERQREREEEERKARRRKGGRKSKKGRASEIKGKVVTEVKTTDVDINGTPASTPAKKVEPAPIKIADPLPSPKADSTPPAKDLAPPQPAVDDSPPEPMEIEPSVTATVPTPAPEPTQATPHPSERNIQPEVLASTSVISSDISEAQPEAKVERGQKRKLPSEISTGSKEADQVEPSSKIRKTSTSTKTKPPITPTQRRKSSFSASASKRDIKGAVLQTELVENISELQSEPRRRIALALVKLFVEQTQQAEKQGAFKLPSGQAPDTFGLRLGLAVEYAIYLNFWGQSEQPSNTYADRFRTILHNVRANTALRDRLLDGSLPPNQFSQMTTDEMASKELQEKTVEMRKEAEKQHMLVQEDGPRIRRTHKGEELVGGDESQVAAVADQVYSQPIIRRREPDIDTRAPKQASPEATSPHSPAAVELPDNIPVTTRSPTAVAPLVVDTKAPPPRAPTATERKSSTAFNIQNVWSSVSGSDGDNQRPRLPPQRTELEQEPLQHPAAVVEADADIERLLNEEDPEDEEPYSPTDYTTDLGSSVWRGKMMMAGVAGFTGVAKHVAGANLSSTFPWAQLIPSTLTIEGRIDIERASEYLCGLRWSQSTDVTVVAITPIDDPNARVHFDKLFKYFTERKRYGVIGKNPFGAVKDTYLVPLEAGMSKKPDFVELLEYCTIEDPSPERMLLLTFVVKSNNSPSAQATPRNNLDASSIASPITGSVQQTPTPFPSLSKTISHASPTQSYTGMVHAMGPLASSSPQPPQHSFVPPQHSSPYTALPQQPPIPMTPVQNFHSGPPTGMDAARKTLGDMATVPSVAQLLAEAPNTGVPEFEVIKDMLESAPASRNDFKLLKDMLAMKYHQGGGS